MIFNNSFPRRPIRLVAWEVMRGIFELACRSWFPGVVIIRPIAWAMHRRRWFGTSIVVLALLAGLRYNNWELPELSTIQKKFSFFQGKPPKVEARPVQAGFLFSLANPELTIEELWGQVQGEELAWGGATNEQIFYLAYMLGARSRADILTFANKKYASRADWARLGSYIKSIDDPIRKGKK